MTLRFASGLRWVSIVAWVALIAVPLAACSQPPPDDGQAFLLRNRSQWDQTGSTKVQPAPLVPTAVPTRAPTPTTASRPVVFIDAGHGGVDTGTIGTTSDGTQVEEKNMALALALQTAADLRNAGYNVVLSRTDDSLPGSQPSDYTDGGTTLTASGVLHDLQRRIDRANASGAKLLLSIHLNAFSDPSIAGTQTFYDGARPFAAQSERFAALVQNNIVGALHADGYSFPDRGVTDDQDLQAESLGALSGDYNHIVLLGPAVPGQLQPSQMPGALCETLFLSDPAEATAVVQSQVQQVIAAGYAKAVEEYFQGKAP
jgi:N-acetylmuramoyl-L-alanine amidase